MYREQYSRAYRRPCPAFTALVSKYYEETKDPEALTYLNFANSKTAIKMRMFWDMRNKIAQYRDDKRLAYLCSPESETYWCS